MSLVVFLNTPLQDNTPAGIIYAEDIQDISSDYEEAQKDISKVTHVRHDSALRYCGNPTHSMDSHLRLLPAEELSYLTPLRQPRE